MSRSFLLYTCNIIPLSVPRKLTSSFRKPFSFFLILKLVFFFLCGLAKAQSWQLSPTYPCGFVSYIGLAFYCRKGPLSPILFYRNPSCLLADMNQFFYPNLNPRRLYGSHHNNLADTDYHQPCGDAIFHHQGDVGRIQTPQSSATRSRKGSVPWFRAIRPLIPNTASMRLHHHNCGTLLNSAS